MSRVKIQVLSVENRSGRSKSGNDYSMDVCQCAVHEVGEDGKERLQIGELILPKNHPVVSVGMYEAEFGVSISQDKRIGGRLVQLFPVGASRSVSSPAKPA